jgi:myo-inositol-1-phosphate synthase
VDTKVGKDLSEAIYAFPNNTYKFADVPFKDIPVSRGMTHDGLGKYLSEIVTKAPGPTDDIIGILNDTKTDVVVSFLPVGSEMATKWYVEQILDAGCAFVNGIPVFIASSEYWSKRFEERGLPIIGDDVKSQVGATILHRVMTSLFVDRGVHLDRTYQLNFGDDTDIHVGPSDYVPWLTDRKWCHIRMEGTTFGDVPLTIEAKLEVWDSPNSAGVMIDAVRCAKLALDRNIAGPLIGPSSYFMKTPPQQFKDEIAREKTEAFILGDQE